MGSTSSSVGRTPLDGVSGCRRLAARAPAGGGVRRIETAAELFGRPPIDSPDVHAVVLARGGCSPSGADLRVHVRQLRAGRTSSTQVGLRLTSGAQTFLDLAGRTAPAELVAVGDASAAGRPPDRRAPSHERLDAGRRGARCGAGA